MFVPNNESRSDESWPTQVSFCMSQLWSSANVNQDARMKNEGCWQVDVRALKETLRDGLQALQSQPAMDSPTAPPTEQVIPRFIPLHACLRMSENISELHGTGLLTLVSHIACLTPIRDNQGPVAGTFTNKFKAVLSESWTVACFGCPPLVKKCIIVSNKISFRTKTSFALQEPACAMPQDGTTHVRRHSHGFLLCKRIADAKSVAQS